jgi:hypothetical protein
LARHNATASERLIAQAGDDAGGASDAEMFLRDALAGGREDSALLARRAESDYGIKRRTLQRAANRLGAVKESVGFGAGRKIYWKSPSVIDDTISDTQAEVVADGLKPIKSALFNRPPIIDDILLKTVADVSPMATEEMFEAEV